MFLTILININLIKKILKRETTVIKNFLKILVRSRNILYLPKRASTPHRPQTIRLRPTEPLLCSTPFGEIKIPEPRENTEKKYV